MLILNFVTLFKVKYQTFAKKKQMKKKILNLKKLRTDYNAGMLDEKAVPDDPFLLFRKWMREAIKVHQMEPNAACLSTCGQDCQPRGRMVLLKGMEKEGFIFFTNYESDKAKEMEFNQRASLTFYWYSNARQVRIEGKVKKLSRKQNTAYFSTRPRLSQIGAWASHQSKVIIGREELEDWFEFYKNKFKGKKIPCPDYWGGYALIPFRIEFWQGRMNRLHDRLVYKRQNGIWEIQRLSP
jgi:pyridoxamine 5'-phosphate oxidase